MFFFHIIPSSLRDHATQHDFCTARLFHERAKNRVGLLQTTLNAAHNTLHPYPPSGETKKKDENEEKSPKNPKKRKPPLYNNILRTIDQAASSRHSPAQIRLLLVIFRFFTSHTRFMYLFPYLFLFLSFSFHRNGFKKKKKTQ